MIAAMLKDSPDIGAAARKTTVAVRENGQALCDLLDCLQGVGETGRNRIALFIKEVADDEGNISRL